MPSFFSKLRRKSRSASGSSTSEVNLNPSTSSPAFQPTPPRPTGVAAPASPARAQDASERRLPSTPVGTAGPSRGTPSHKSRTSFEADEVPPRTTSLYAPAAMTNIPSSPQRASMPPASRQAPTAPPPAQTNTGELTTQLGSMSVADSSSAPQLPPLDLHVNPLVPDVPVSTVGSATSPKQLGAVPDLPSLAHQRDELVNRIATEARARKEEHGELSEESKAVFRGAGMDKEIAKGSTLEVETRYIKPVIQEHIIIKEHTETTTVIDQEIHRHHIYPKIQPISDPNPIMLEPRHRIFSALDGKWHEVVGDAAAIAILGKEAFYNGKKEVRQARELALPGFDDDAAQRYDARVVEREGVKGESMGKWQQIRGAMPGAATPGTPGTPGMIGEGWLMPEEDMGPTQRTVGIAL